MKWTKEKPSKEGYYWYMESNTAEIVEIAIFPREIIVWCIAQEYANPIEVFNGEWYGPLEVPE